MSFDNISWNPSHGAFCVSPGAWSKISRWYKSITIDLQINSILDEGYESDESTWSYAGDETYFGKHNGVVYDTGLRWPNINIPNSATINSANLFLLLNQVFVTDAIECTVHGINEDNAVVWNTDGSNRPSTRVKTTFNVNADHMSWGNCCTIGNWITLSLTDIIQEIVNRSGWLSGNAIALVIKNDYTGTFNSLFSTRTYPHDPHNASKLEINYS